MARRTREHQERVGGCFSRHVTSRVAHGLRLLGGEDEPPESGLRSLRQVSSDRLRDLAAVYAVELTAAAFMGNHFHLQARMIEAEAARWSEEGVAERWLRLHPGWRHRGESAEARAARVREHAADAAWVAATRAKLCSLSSFVKDLKQHVAEWHNRTTKSSGCFWQGRFKSFAAADESAELAVQAYIELNPFAAGIGRHPHAGTHTSLEVRLHDEAPHRCHPPAEGDEPCRRRRIRRTRRWLTPLHWGPQEPAPPSGPDRPFRQPRRRLTFDAYLTFLDRLARTLRRGKRHLVEPAAVFTLIEQRAAELLPAEAAAPG
ncbi:hypothetical protein [Phycisphaera mikurensis]|uniref:Transposase IS200-like domain-containing protein n=1 Tax=Phycisphaera mikurensis (strain NBRC 102666 / KCTC 22515 / FYK2301M01) TaxID=1142394 RepID=I0IH06_PHYMF|nr:hypothetical protein [Phycisphaera mikurensis]MBB6440800.1 hypothetical protein [Phycisphaera mikurensis]BAM04544.1 hypothetical protein PSMK_23850 [Phycisphaera mikurensis NBRC 102666]